MDYMILEYLVCILAVFGFATLLFVISLVPMLAHEGLAYVSETKRKAGSQTSQLVVGLGGHALEGGRSVFLGDRERWRRSLSSENSPRPFTGATW